MKKVNGSLLVSQAREYLKTLSGNYGQLKNAAIAIGVSEHWLYKFHQGKIENPSVKRVEKLLQYGGFEISLGKPENNNNED